MEEVGASPSAVTTSARVFGREKEKDFNKSVPHRRLGEAASPCAIVSVSIDTDPETSGDI